ncbi:MAG TPA: hypothetical protein VFN26_17820 [Candidatus Acidoferrum sp.]|nr:hypothetical protein [Candidatus Acidoferrum sp.]
MMPFRFVLPILIIAVAALSSPKPALVQAAPHPQATNGSPARGPIVYVSDFELDVFSGRAKTRSAPQAASRPATTSRQTASSGQPSGSSSTAQRIASSSPSPNKRNAAQTADPQLDDNPAERASELVNAVSENIVSALEEAGYKVHRLRAGEALPAKGLRIRRLCRAG